MLSATIVSNNSSGTGAASVLAWNSRTNASSIGSTNPATIVRNSVDHVSRDLCEGADEHQAANQIRAPLGDPLADERAERVAHEDGPFDAERVAAAR